MIMSYSARQYYINLFKNRWFNFLHGTRAEKSIYINSSPNGEMRRYLYILAKFLAMNGYKVFVKAHFNIFKALVDYANFFLDEANIVLVKKDIKADYIITYKEPSEPNEIQMDYNYFGKGNGLYFPYPMQPGQYKFNYISQIDKLRCNDRIITALFMGGVSENYKENEKLKPFRIKYGIVNRYEAYHFLLNEKDVVIVPVNSEEAMHCFNSDVRIDKTLLVNNINCIVQQPEWLKCMSKSDFIICLPGAEQPMCHHAIEAMSVGTIPILQYNRLFNPPLEDMKNCVLFKDLAHLRNLLSMIRSMPGDQVTELRRNVIAYYDKYLSQVAFVKKFEEYMESDCYDKRLYINIEYPHSIEDMR